MLVHTADVATPGATHALVVGVGTYPHLLGGSGRPTSKHDGMEQLTSPPLSARAFAKWLIAEFRHPEKGLASVELLLSDAGTQSFEHPLTGKVIDVPPATMEHVRPAVGRLFDRANKSVNNLVLFYFCGHGVSSGTETALLLADYGADPMDAFAGAIDFRRMRLGLRQAQAREQVFFVDACRASTDRLLNADDGDRGQRIIGAGSRDPGLGLCRNPVFYATSNGSKAYAKPGQPTIFTGALLDSLRNFGASNDVAEDDWRVGTNQLLKAIERLSTRRSAGIGKQQVPNSDDTSEVHVTFLEEAPRAAVFFTSSPAEALEQASLSYRLEEGPIEQVEPDRDVAQEWELHLPMGRYLFDVTFGANSVTVDRTVRVPFVSVNAKAF